MTVNEKVLLDVYGIISPYSAHMLQSELPLMSVRQLYLIQLIGCMPFYIRVLVLLERYKLNCTRCKTNITAQEFFARTKGIHKDSLHVNMFHGHNNCPLGGPKFY